MRACTDPTCATACWHRASIRKAAIGAIQRSCRTAGLFGMTKGEGKERVAFCIECHAASGDEHDHLFFMPKKHRKRFLAPSADAK
jgi:hypothetical protein